MQSVGAAWLMVSLHAGPLYVALIQTASAFPFFLFALPAGALGDIVDRRRLILVAEIWMAGVALAPSRYRHRARLSAIPPADDIRPFCRRRLRKPGLASELPESVEKDDLAPASALNGIEFNSAGVMGRRLAES